MDEKAQHSDLMTADEVADYLRVSKTTVCRWCKQGQLRAFRIGRSWRVQRSELEAHIRRTANIALGPDDRQIEAL